MARITVVSMAFWGDVMPFVPIANALSQRGHDVTFAVPEGFWPVLEHEAFRVVSAGTQFSPAELAEHGSRIDRATSAMGTARAARFWINEFGVRPLRSIHEALLDATEGADLVLTHPTAGFVSRMAAEQRGIPWATGHLFPMLFPSETRLPPGWPSEVFVHHPSKRHARFAWNAMRTMSGRMMYDREINAYRHELGLAPVSANAMIGGLSPSLVLLLWSQRWAPSAVDWPSTYVPTGFTIWDGPSGTSLPDGLAEYLGEGEPPILVSLGTSAASNARTLFDQIATVLDRNHLRAVFLVGNDTEVSPSLRARPDVWAFAPITAVLPRCAAVVHAGGHGTTAATLAAGVPSVVVPMLFDQQWHAHRAEELGLGTVVARGRGFIERLEAAIRATVHDSSLHERSARFAAELVSENGPSAAADALEGLLV